MFKPQRIFFLTCALAMGFLLIPAGCRPLRGAEHKPAHYPQLTLSNGMIEALILLPDEQAGYYRSTRFDWGGLIGQAFCKGHTFFQPWENDDATPFFQEHDPLNPGASTGNAEEFRIPLGYEDARPGEGFVKIGVGVLEKPADRTDYHFNGKYRILDFGERTLRNGPNWAEFEHVLKTDSGYAYRYCKRIELVPGTTTIRVHHALTNTGTQEIDTTTYCHNFVQLNKARVGTDYTMTFPEAIRAVDEMDPIVRIEGSCLGFSGDLEEGHAVWGRVDVGQEYDVQIGIDSTKTAVSIRGDRPILNCFMWAWPYALCAEPMIEIQVTSGQTMTWQYDYELIAPSTEGSSEMDGGCENEEHAEN